GEGPPSWPPRSDRHPPGRQPPVCIRARRRAHPVAIIFISRLQAFPAPTTFLPKSLSPQRIGAARLDARAFGMSAKSSRPGTLFVVVCFWVQDGGPENRARGPVAPGSNRGGRKQVSCHFSLRAPASPLLPQLSRVASNEVTLRPRNWYFRESLALPA